MNTMSQLFHRYKIMNDLHSGNCSLSISFLLPDEDFGTYTCIASNVKGQVSTEASLLDEGTLTLCGLICPDFSDIKGSEFDTP